MADLRSETRESIEKLRGVMADMRADLTWRMNAVVGFVGTLVAIVNAFVA